MASIIFFFGTILALIIQKIISDEDEDISKNNEKKIVM
jgi:hypothetical protein